MLGSNGESHNHIEENTHIAYLCDLLERIWGHGLKKREVYSNHVCVCVMYMYIVNTLQVGLYVRETTTSTCKYFSIVCYHNPPPLPQSKSPLWSHLMAYAETAGKDELLPPSNPSPLAYSRELTQSMSSLSMLSTTTTAGGECVCVCVDYFFVCV